MNFLSLSNDEPVTTLEDVAGISSIHFVSSMARAAVLTHPNYITRITPPYPPYLLALLMLNDVVLQAKASAKL